jgi:uncharacterized RDD family membrane protein YckC
MITADLYVNQVLAHMPRTTPRRDEIANELRSHIDDRIGLGDTLEGVLKQLGDPLRLAESYLADMPMVPATFGRRLAAKAIDLSLVWGLLAPMGYLVWRVASYRTFTLMMIALAIIGVFAPLAIYSAIAEYTTARTIGKELLGLRVVRDSGARIGVAGALIRQIPTWMQFHLIDGLFALFTEHRQRAFELLSRTRVVRVQ